MSRGLTVSLLLHGLAMVLIFFGMPRLFDRPLLVERVVVVELVAIADTRNLPQQITPKTKEPAEPKVEPPKAEKQPEPKAPRRPEPSPAPPEPKMAEAPAPPEPAPAPKPLASPPPKPEPLPVPQAEIAPIPPPKPAPKPEPKPAPEPAVIAQAPMPSEVARPKKKPAPPPPPDPFASVLKSIEEMEVRAPKPDKPEPAETPPVASPAEDPVDQILARAESTFRPELGLSMSEIDNIRWQIQRNWNPPAGALDAAEMIVALRIQLRPDGSVSAVTIVDSGRINSDPFYRAMAESAVRAVKITGRIENLSAQKYDLWRDILINFDPREMYG